MSRLAAILSALALAACVTTRPGATEPSWPPILSGAVFKEPREVTQIVRGAFADRDLTLQCAVQVQGSVVTVAGIGTLGQRLFTLSYDGTRLTAESSPLVPGAFAPERLLADLELALWPLSALQAAYADTKWEVNEPYPGARRLRRDGKLVAEVHFGGNDPWSTRYWISNLEFGYTLSIEPLPPDS